MHQSSSSSKSHIQKSSSACPTKMKMHKQRVRNPFQELNSANAIGSATDSSSNASSVSSIDAPKGCLRFFLSHTSSNNKTYCSNSNHGLSRKKPISTPKSAPNLRPTKENSSKRFNFHKPQKLERCKKNPPGLRNANVSSVLNSNGSSKNKNKSDSREVEQVVVGDFDGLNLTPVNKVSSLNLIVGNGVVNETSKTDCSSNTKSTGSNNKTPPIQASVSPEIQCGSSMVTTAAKTITPVCYGAGFVMSGVTDKRKCRPRGILTIGEAMPLTCFDIEDETEQELGLDIDSAISALPLPSEASMRWLLSPCNEEDEEKKDDSESLLFGFSKPSPASDEFSPNQSALLSPSRGFTGPPLYDKARALCSEEEKKNCSDLAEEASQFSPASLSSGNVIQTPQSDCSDGKYNGFDYKLDSIAERIQNASLSPKGYVSIWDPAGSSFQFDCLGSPSNSVDLSHFQKVLDDRTSWLSDSTMGNVSQSRMRISWREGLVSRMFEMDEFDSCWCLSDVEDDSIVLESKFSPGMNVDVVKESNTSNDSGCTIDVKSGHGNDREVEEKLTHRVQCRCAESISTDAGSLVRSEDSDWAMCYKNRLFQ